MTSTQQKGSSDSWDQSPGDLGGVHQTGIVKEVGRLTKTRLHSHLSVQHRHLVTLGFFFRSLKVEVTK